MTLKEFIFLTKWAFVEYEHGITRQEVKEFFQDQDEVLAFYDQDYLETLNLYLEFPRLLSLESREPLNSASQTSIGETLEW